RRQQSLGRSELRQHPRTQPDHRVPLLRLEPGSSSLAGKHQAGLLGHKASGGAARYGDSAGAHSARESPESTRSRRRRSALATLRRPHLRSPQGQAEALLAIPTLRLAAHTSEGSLMYRLIDPWQRQELSLRMLFQPLGEGVYLEACEADSFRGLVAALLDDAGYETATAKSRLAERLRLADDLRLLEGLDNRRIRVSDRDEGNAINISSDEPFIRSLDRLGVLS